MNEYVSSFFLKVPGYKCAVCCCFYYMHGDILAHESTNYRHYITDWTYLSKLFSLLIELGHRDRCIVFTYNQQMNSVC